MPTSLVKESDVDVLVVGAGPAGLMCANGLAKAGINVRIVDQRPGDLLAGRADGLQPRTLGIYGLAERVFKEANQMHMAAFYNPSPDGGWKLTDRAPDVTAPTARYPFECTLHQGAIEAIFHDSMRSMGVQVDRPTVPESIQMSQDADVLKDPTAYPVRVRVVLKHLRAADGEVDTEVVHAKFVVGADGAHSWVRKSLDIQMEGEQTDYVWGVVDLVPDTDFPDIRNRCAIHSNNGSCMIIPREGDKVRLYIQLGHTDAVDSANGRVDMSKTSPYKLMEVAKKSLQPFYITNSGDIDWWTIYIIGQRVASKFSVNNRVFIAGDACHTHSPKAGQGMNASMNDTHNLVWKLTYVLRGWADMSLLDTYEFERRKYAQDLINFDKQFSALFSGKPRTQEYQDGVSHEEFKKAFQTFGGFTSGIGIRYAESLITNCKYQDYASNLKIGRRMPPQILLRAADSRPVELQDLLPSDTRFKVLVFAGDISSPSQQDKLSELSERLGRPGALLDPTRVGSHRSMLDVLTIGIASKWTVRYTDIPPLFHSHWSKVLIDDSDPHERSGGKAYTSFGVNPSGAIIIVRPDGYVGMVAPFVAVDDIERYFDSFAAKP
ncbi:hypothetical protein EYR40_008541 [Pleurotus pulmonarius]|nr:hypothetical protein EYR36_009358 [Pleurotus pulmonarius]KAF4592853.1 hypothetical protein EYR38_008559 [Pleurotus pulmonarius]KAF4593747.1 hypothetical protein EYR40_008541 [Pleurotus pulmonarius]